MTSYNHIPRTKYYLPPGRGPYHVRSYMNQKCIPYNLFCIKDILDHNTIKEINTPLSRHVNAPSHAQHTYATVVAHFINKLPK